jgi:ATP-dependent DNA ligase
VQVAFDLLYLNGYDLRRLPLIERKPHLKKIVDGTDIQYSESFEVEGREMFATAKDLQTRLKPLIRKTQPYTKGITHRGIWVEPKLRAEIEYRPKSAEGNVRYPFLQGHPRRPMNWGHIVRNTAIAIGITFITTVGVFLAIRFLQSVL